MGDDHSCPVAKVRKNRCERCDRPLADAAQRAMIDACDGPPCSCQAELDRVCYGGPDSACTPIDWRARALAAEAELDALICGDHGVSREFNALAVLDLYQQRADDAEAIGLRCVDLAAVEFARCTIAESIARRALVEGLAECERLRDITEHSIRADAARAERERVVAWLRALPTDDYSSFGLAGCIERGDHAKGGG